MIEKTATPMILQYLSIKDKYKDSLLFFRMGDFYELFFEDAKLASSFLGIVLTKKGKYQDKDIPMCGIPYHSNQSYIHRLVKSGYKVAICEQVESVEDSKKRGYKSVVKRDVVRVITSGTITEEEILNHKENNFILNIHFVKDSVFLSWLDLSIGDLFIESSTIDNIINFLSKVEPKEILINSVYQDITNIQNNYILNTINFLNKHYKNIITYQESLFYSQEICKKNCEDVFKSQIFFNDLDKNFIISVGSLISYLVNTQKSSNLNISLPQTVNQKKFLSLDSFTRKSLELDKSLNNQTVGTLKSVIDYTKTSSGSRLISNWLNFPLTSIDAIEERLQCIDYFLVEQDILLKLQKILESFPDTQRCLSRLILNRYTYKDVLSIKESLSIFYKIKELFLHKNIPQYINIANIASNNFSTILSKIENSVIEDSTINYKDGGFCKFGFSKELDGLRKFKDNINHLIIDLQNKYIKHTKILTLKISYNNLIGYFIEVSTKNINESLLDKIFIHKQTLSNVVRYTTEEILELESKILKSKTSILDLELFILNDIVKDIIAVKEVIQDYLNYIAKLDVILSLTYISNKYNFTRPKINNSRDFKVVGGRHLVIESQLKNEQKFFIENNCIMDDSKNFFIITGPNMAGKSTFLRQNCHIIILAQIGCYIPAKEGVIGIVDAIFSRVGSSDDLFKGSSTFMVEMLETSSILRSATKNSFIILDEVGRGTSTLDGLSIAWATIEYITSKIQARTLFATHYHELHNLENSTNTIANYTIKTKQSNQEIVFLHELIKGFSNKSYGIYVAKIANMPNELILRATEILNYLESTNFSLDVMNRLKDGKTKQTDNKTIDLFSSNNINPTNKDLSHNEDKQKDYSNIIQDLKDLSPDNLTPKEALNYLYHLSSKIKSIT
jgi:DNA mismatch repair protein MutS